VIRLSLELPDRKGKAGFDEFVQTLNNAVVGSIPLIINGDKLFIDCD
jgi:hypothetical protein